MIEKTEIIQQMDKCKNFSDLAVFYGVGCAIQDNIFGKDLSSKGSDRKFLKGDEHPLVEDTLHTWFLQECNKHTPMAEELIKEKATFFYM